MLKLFASSTCYDLGNVRSQIENWATKHGYLPLLSDRATFPVDPSMHRHDVCLANARQADLLVLVISTRFGAPYFRDKSVSITWAEYRAASQANVPIIAFVDRRVWNEKHSYGSGTAPVLTENVRTFEFVSEVQRNEHGYWSEIYDDLGVIPQRLANLTKLFPVALTESQTGLRRDGKYIVTESLAPEAQHHVSLTVGDKPLLSADDLQWAMIAIPEAAIETPDPPMMLHGFSVIVAMHPSQVGATKNGVVRPTRLGEAIREELMRAFCLL